MLNSLLNLFGGNGLSRASNQKAARKNRKGRAGGDAETYPLRVAKVMRVDPVKMVVSLYMLTGNGDPKEQVALTFPNAGARHFLGSIPEVNDLCVVGYSPAESGATRTPYIVGWLVPGPKAGYDWLTTGPLTPEELPQTPAMDLATDGLAGHRRHKLKQLEVGNVCASSSQGADLLLNESATFANRRGNEIILRDQDQALVIRSLQQFHAGAGFRIYGGAVQRDAQLLPTQAFGGSEDYAAGRQLNEEGKPLVSGEFASSADFGKFIANPALKSGIRMGLNPLQDLQNAGLVGVSGTKATTFTNAVYGGKPMFRVATGGGNGVVSDQPNFSEYRIEVSYNNDGTLPVTEQTDGVDIDRFPRAPAMGADGAPNTSATSPNAAHVEFVLGTAIGNDAFGEGKTAYARPLVPSLFDDQGTLSPSLKAATADTPVTEHAAVLLRVKNPNGGPEAFWSITKGGALRQYFPGTGSDTAQTYYATGKYEKVEGPSTVDAPSHNIQATGTGEGIKMKADRAPVSIYAGGLDANGSANAGDNPDLSPGSKQIALSMKSGKSLEMGAVGDVHVSGVNVLTKDAKNIVNACSDSHSIDVQAGTATKTAQTVAQTSMKKTTITCGGGGPLKPVEGAALDISVSAMGIGAAEISRSVLFGGISDSITTMGKWDSNIAVGSRQISTMSPPLPSVGPGQGFKASTGLPFINNSIDADLIGAGATCMAPGGTAKLLSPTGSAAILGSMTATMTSPALVGITSAFVKFNVPTIPGGVLGDGCIDGFAGRPFVTCGTFGAPTCRF